VVETKTVRIDVVVDRSRSKVTELGPWLRILNRVSK
jgi:hypothetical protein